MESAQLSARMEFAISVFDARPSHIEFHQTVNSPARLRDREQAKLCALASQYLNLMAKHLAVSSDSSSASESTSGDGQPHTLVVMAEFGGNVVSPNANLRIDQDASSITALSPKAQARLIFVASRFLAMAFQKFERGGNDVRH